MPDTTPPDDQVNIEPVDKATTMIPDDFESFYGPVFATNDQQERHEVQLQETPFKVTILKFTGSYLTCGVDGCAHCPHTISVMLTPGKDLELFTDLGDLIADQIHIHRTPKIAETPVTSTPPQG